MTTAPAQTPPVELKHATQEKARIMSIPPFERKIEIGDFDFLERSRLAQTTVIWPEQAIALVGYMAWPNEPELRASR